MGSIVSRGVQGSTTNTTSYVQASAITPVAGRLLFVVVHASGTQATDSTLTASANGMTFTKVADLVQTLAGNLTTLWISNQVVPASPTSMKLTWTCTSDAATGAFIAVAEVVGASAVGLAAVKQTGLNPNAVSSQPWTASFASAPDTNNPILGFIGHGGGAAVTPPTGLTELDEPVDQVTPAVGFEWAKSDSGLTNTSYTWTSSLGSPAGNTRANIGVIEFDTGSVVVAPAGFTGWGVPI